jgi:hypothetical protein
VCVCVCVCACVGVCVCTYMRKCAQICVRMYAYVYSCVRGGEGNGTVSVHMCMYVCIPISSRGDLAQIAPACISKCECASL